MLGKKLQAYVAEIRAITLISPILCEATMQTAIEYIQELLSTHFAAQLLGTKMHRYCFPMTLNSGLIMIVKSTVFIKSLIRSNMGGGEYLSLPTESVTWNAI